MTLIIEGVAFPLGKKNLNGWGVPRDEAGNAISSLKSAVIRICPHMDQPHGTPETPTSPPTCDYAEDPYSVIGHVIDAYQEGTDIFAKAEITTPKAAEKIKNGDWKLNWSTFLSGHPDNEDGSGWWHNIDVRSMTLVQDPAWPDAKFKVVAASSGGGIRFISSFKISQEGISITDDPLEEAGASVDTEDEPGTDELVGDNCSIGTANCHTVASLQQAIDTHVADKKAMAAEIDKHKQEKEMLLEHAAALTATVDSLKSALEAQQPNSSDDELIAGDDIDAGASMTDTKDSKIEELKKAIAALEKGAEPDVSVTNEIMKVFTARDAENQKATAAAIKNAIEDYKADLVKQAEASRRESAMKKLEEARAKRGIAHHPEQLAVASIEDIESLANDLNRQTAELEKMGPAGSYTGNSGQKNIGNGIDLGVFDPYNPNRFDGGNC